MLLTVIRNFLRTGLIFTMAGVLSSNKCRRFPSVQGSDSKYNDVIICGSINTAKHHLLFFSGDVQDYPEKMKAHRDNVQYLEWNLESTAELLQNKFNDAVIFVVKPSKMFLQTFSIYSNFVESNQEGTPTFSSEFGGFTHLIKLYSNACRLAFEDENKSTTNEGSCHRNEVESGCETDENSACLMSRRVPISIMGFSKGCVVLNQLVYELEQIDKNEELKNFSSNIHAMYWLDGGHIGGSRAWITDDDVLVRLKNLGCKIVIHVTPYQIRDPMRAWIGKEESKFVAKLKKLGAKIEQHVHFDNEDRSITNHFKVLTVVKPV
ncbi:hypothetical protein CHS0354_043022 [Potamilus streckersoni]|uniref:Uncharacterized protein n=1 Tax=Potamilus streckersoni TaxID=2493646 RepID=A0AAE0SCK3_9BIVA|nr:hypothetical protein CHS0354_043022 [Potamilus streckersoni]